MSETVPIKPENRARYPKDWKRISAEIRDRAGNRCEFCLAENGKTHPITGSTVVLTCAHLDHQPENCDPSNLKALCQRCHNRYDRPHRKVNAARTNRAKKASGDLFDGEQDKVRDDDPGESEKERD